MGCMTSREWPPRPFKRYVVRNYKEVDVNNVYRGGTVETVEDYVWVQPGESHPSTKHGPEANWKEELGPWQEVAVRQLEDG